MGCCRSRNYKLIRVIEDFKNSDGRVAKYEDLAFKKAIFMLDDSLSYDILKIIKVEFILEESSKYQCLCEFWTIKIETNFHETLNFNKRP